MNDRDASYTLADREEETEWEEGQTRDLRRKYMELLDKYPLTTKSCTSALLGALGAIIAGMSIERSSGRRLRRVEGVRWLDVLAYAICGALQGPLGHYWYAWWEENGPESQSNSMLVDRILVQPPMILLLYVSLDVIKAALKEIVPSFQRSMAVLGPVVVSSWRFWPVVLYLTGQVIKRRKNRVAVLKLWSLLWDVYICKQRRSLPSLQ